MKPRIGAIMQPEVWEAFSRACESLDCDAVLLLDAPGGGAGSHRFEDIHAVVIEISEEKAVIDAAQKAHAALLPMAGLAVDDHTHSPSVAGLCELILTSPEDLRVWVKEISAPEAQREKGSLTVIFGANGAPGRTTLALSLARELSQRSRKVVVIDADHSAPSLAFLAGMSGETGGIQTALRSARVEGADIRTLLAPMARVEESGSSYRLLSGGVMTPGGTVFEPRALKSLLSCLVEAGFQCVIDTAAISTCDTHHVLEIVTPLAHRLVGVSHPSDLGITRFIRSWTAVESLSPTDTPRILVRSPREGMSTSRDAVRHTLWEYTACEAIDFLDNPGGSLATGAGEGLLAIRTLADEIVGKPDRRGVIGPQKSLAPQKPPRRLLQRLGGSG